MIVTLNGPLGIGKSTLAEALTESIDSCVMLDGDKLIAVNPPQVDELDHLHTIIMLLIKHQRQFGYRHFIINHIWRTPAELADLRMRLEAVDNEVHCFLLTLSADENLRRLERRATARVIDELEFERRTFQEERAELSRSIDASLGEPFDVSAPPEMLVAQMLRRVGLMDD